MTEIPDGWHAMSEEEFTRRWADTHTELKVGSLIAKSPGDRNITRYGDIPGKHAIESDCAETRALKENMMLSDAIRVRSTDLLDRDQINIAKLFELAIKTRPQKVEAEHKITFADMVKQVTVEMKKYDTIDAETIARPSTDGEYNPEVQE